MSTKPRTDSLTTVQLYNLDHACDLLRRAFDTPYLVGTAARGGAFRDVDVRLMLAEDDYAAACPTIERWELLSLAISTWLSERTGLPIDFQIQRTNVANERYPDGPRNPLGMKRRFAGLGDGTATPASVNVRDEPDDGADAQQHPGDGPDEAIDGRHG